MELKRSGVPVIEACNQLEKYTQEGKTLRDYITSAQAEEEEQALQEMIDALKATVDKSKAKNYLEDKLGQSLSRPKVNIELNKLLREFILQNNL